MIYHFTLHILCWFLDFVLTVEPNWSTLFTGESVTLICDMREEEGTDWHYTILKDGQEYFYTAPKMSYTLPLLTTGYSGEYQCFGRHKSRAYYQKRSNKVSLTVSGKCLSFTTMTKFTKSTYL